MTVETQNVFRFAEFEVREQELRVTRSGQPLAIEPKALRVLLYLLHHNGHLVPKEDLFKAVWGDTAVTDNSLTRAIALLRRVLGDDPHQPHFIETVATAGYRFICPVETDAMSPTPESGDGSSTSLTHENGGVSSMPSAASRPGVLLARRRRGSVIALCAVLILAGFASISYFRKPLSPPHVSQIKQLTNDVRWMRKIPIGTDGNRVYFHLESFNSRHGFGQVPAGGGDLSTIPLDLKGGNGFLTGDISPDGSSALLWSEQREDGAPAWLVGTSGSPVRYLTDVVSAAWWPDGKQVLYLSPSGELRLMPVEGGASRLLARLQPSARHFSVSVDGKRIRFDSDWKLWEMTIDGTTPHEFLPKMRGSVQRCCGRWSPDGAFYTFLSAKTVATTPIRGGFQVWLLDERRERIWKPKPEPVQLTLDPLQWISPVFSRDATTIFTGGASYQGELVRYDRTTRQFQRYLNGISAEWVEFSRDGNFVAYATFPDHKIWRANQDGSGSVLLAQTEGMPGSIHWSPDGRQIVYAESFTGWSTGRRCRVNVAPADGGKPVEIPLDGTQSASGCDPTWSPEGKSLAYTANPSNRAGETEIHVYNLETHAATGLPRAPKPAWSPRWSPDGRYIFCLAGVSDPVIEIFDVNSRQWKLIPRPAGYPSWSRDSRSVTFISAEGESGAFYRMAIPSGAMERVVSLKDIRMTGSIDHGWFGVDADNAPLLLRDAASFEIYSLVLERK